MIQIIGIGGLPATGKTALVREVMARGGPTTPFVYRLLRGHACTMLPLVVLGIYEDEHTFAGTDRLSMAVLKDAVAFMCHAARDPGLNGCTILFEGDRLFTRKFITQLYRLDATVALFVLEAAPKILEARHAARDNQSEIWLRGRRTKYENLYRAFPAIRQVPHETQDDMAAARSTVLDLVYGFAAARIPV